MIHRRMVGFEWLGGTLGLADIQKYCSLFRGYAGLQCQRLPRVAKKLVFGGFEARQVVMKPAMLIAQAS